jgi:SAM-dependent methyltransferase
MIGPRDDLHHETARAWDVVARGKYRAEFDEHVALLRSGRHNLLAPEFAVLAPLLPGSHVVHLQCSHGLDTLGLLNAGADSVLGIDISAEMISQAREKAAALNMPAEFICADAVAPPVALTETADIVYTGRGAVPWILDLGAWAASVRRLLRPGGHLFLFEGHPLDALWERDADHLAPRAGVSYFDDDAREHPGFPSNVVRRELGNDRPQMRERHWRPGQVIDELLEAGVSLLHFREYPTQFWDQFPNWPGGVREGLPHSYSVLARRADEGHEDLPKTR